jgi:hypothetical protein
MRNLGGGFWENGTQAVEKGVPALSDDMVRREEEWDNYFREELYGLNSIQVDDGCVMLRLHAYI